MTREELIDCINDDINPRTCPEYSCNMPEEENNVGKCCRECAEKQLEDYEEKIRADERKKAEQEFQNSDYWNDYLAKVLADEREKSVKDFAEWLPKHFDLRFAINPKVWLDEYFNHTSEKILKEQKNADTILCLNKEDAKNAIDSIGGKYIKDWEYLPTGEIRLFLKEGWRGENKAERR